MQKQLRVDDLVNRLARKERDLKNAGAYALAEGVRDSIVTVLRMADESEPSIDSSDEQEAS